jgi:hypothetical protein
MIVSEGVLFAAALGLPSDIKATVQNLFIGRKNRVGADWAIGYLLPDITNGGIVMGFQIQSLAAENFEHLFVLTDAELAQQHACKMVVTENLGAPCRVSLVDAEVGETVVLTHFTHQSADTAYRASHAVYVREGVSARTIAENKVPKVLRSRLISILSFDEDHMMVGGDVAPGEDLAAALTAAFENDGVSRTSTCTLRSEGALRRW